MVQSFLKHFYEVISFEAGIPFPAEAFAGLFCENALLMEKTEHGYESRTVDDHIREFETAVRDYPALFELGFCERQTDAEWTEHNGVYLVHSSYEKRYARNGVPVVEYGVNHFTIVQVDGELRIACAVW